MSRTSWRLVVLAVALCGVVIASLAHAGQASAASHCTRFHGFPSGIFTPNCPTVNGYEWIGVGGRASTGSTARRDYSSMEVTAQVCQPLRMKLWWSAVLGGAATGTVTTSYSCQLGWNNFSGTGNNYRYANCGLVHDNGTYYTRQAHCTTVWHD